MAPNPNGKPAVPFLSAKDYNPCEPGFKCAEAFNSEDKINYN